MHDVCAKQLAPGKKVRIRKETHISLVNGEEEAVLAAYIVGDGTMMCKVRFLPRHLSLCRADDYDGMYARVDEVYSTYSINITKRQKHHQNHDCCVAKILGNEPLMSI